ncbi:hypothetical protein TNCV_4766041 [Trichonephila clavipes]|nr:hypothetical protein TNCV_4766041 [Trichonephila clavipes]
MASDLYMDPYPTGHDYAYNDYYGRSTNGIILPHNVYEKSLLVARRNEPILNFDTKEMTLLKSIVKDLPANRVASEKVSS